MLKIVPDFENANEVTHDQKRPMTDILGIQGSTDFRMLFIGFISVLRYFMSSMS